MESTEKKISLELLPWLVVHEDGTIKRIAGTETCPPGFDPETRVLSKDITMEPETGLSGRIYRSDPVLPGGKLPLVLYFHGGGFVVASAAFPNYHKSLNKLVAEGNIIAVSVNYRLAPEHPLPAAYEDSWTTLQWIRSHMTRLGSEPAPGTESWISEFADLDRLFLVGDSAGANISHHLAIRLKRSDQDPNLKIRGIGMIHPYFWGSEPILSEVDDPERKAMVDSWWRFVGRSERGCDDPWINPFGNGSAEVEDLGCERVMICVAEKDVLRERGKEYYERLVKSRSWWRGSAEMVETKGKDHVFHIFEHDCHEAVELIRRLALFMNHA
ncbi:PREDICTED: probable carboxylesterase 2 [Tarenaya hassleriana]|uniref:probable carboxylesterase 2 n=1 Tax=Tarenaya hassleriana TaxID=28532 RepID=UPI00053C6FF8|nr:PREDICTED: probable carboxylesterase 2 [Tarenaya hassleriana]